MASSLSAPDRRERNSSSAPAAVAPRANPSARLDDGVLRILLPPVSWNVVRLEPDTNPAAPTP
jgi:alpha-L-arabinofuranosidase